MRRRCRFHPRFELFTCCVLLLLSCEEEQRAPHAPSYSGTGSHDPADEVRPGRTVGSTPVASMPSDSPDDTEPVAGSGGPSDGLPEGYTAPGASASLEWSDPGDDVLETVEGLRRYPLDIVSVRADSQTGLLRLRVTLDRSLDAHFSFPGIDGEHTAGAPCTFWIDTDDDPATGDTPTWAYESPHAEELLGYEAEVSVLLGYEIEYRSDGSLGAFGGDAIIDTDEHVIVGNYADYWVWETYAESIPGRGWDALDPRELSNLDGFTIELEVPYAWLGVSAGDTVRLTYREHDQGFASGVGYAENKRLTLD